MSIRKIVGGLFGISVNTQGASCPENCPLVQLGQVTGHRFHCEDFSNEQIAQTLNGLVCLILNIHNDLVQEQNGSTVQLSQLFEERCKTIRTRTQNLPGKISEVQIESSRSKAQKPKDNSAILLSLQSDIVQLEKSVEDLQSGLSSKIKSLFISLSNDISKDVKNALNKNSLSQNSTLQELATDIEGLVKELKFNPDNPKPVEILTQKNSEEILKLNKKVIPMIEKASDAIQKAQEAINRSNTLLEQTVDTMSLVKRKLGLEDDISYES
jgi:hypothetical protein